MPVVCPDCKAIWGDMQYRCYDYDLKYEYRDHKRAMFYKCPICSLIFHSHGNDCSMAYYENFRRYEDRVERLEFDLLRSILLRAFIQCGERYRLSDWDW